MKKIILSIIVMGLLSTSSLVSINAFEIEYDISGELELAVNANAEPFEGYVLFTPMFGRNTYLIDNNGEVVNKWSSIHSTAFPVYLLENGNLLRANLKLHPNLVFSSGGLTGNVEMFNWNGQKIWNFAYANIKHQLHHDIEPLPNGNILMIAWEYKTRDEAIAAGRNPNKIQLRRFCPDYIIEVKPTWYFGGDIVWEWHAWDHIIQDYDSSEDNYGSVGDHPELIDINYGDYNYSKDWLHCNSIDYNEEFDQILISSRNFNEIWVIDHSTNTTEAAGHTGGKYGKGGDLLYRWGNPQAYCTGNASNQKLFWQHDARWIEPGCPGEGHITVFNNGPYRPEGKYSSVEEIIPPLDENGNYSLEPGSAYGPEEPVWTYTAENPTDFYGVYLSGAQRLPSGNTLICNGAWGFFFEVTPEKETIWNYTNPFPLRNKDKTVFKIQYYPANYPENKELSANIESGTLQSEVAATEGSQILGQSTPSSSQSNS